MRHYGTSALIPILSIALCVIMLGAANAYDEEQLRIDIYKYVLRPCDQISYMSLNGAHNTGQSFNEHVQRDDVKQLTHKILILTVEMAKVIIKSYSLDVREPSHRGDLLKALLENCLDRIESASLLPEIGIP